MLHVNPQMMGNLLLSNLPQRDMEALSQNLELVEFGQGDMVAPLNESTETVYFPTSGIGSIVAVSPSGKKAEAGLIGREGFFPTWVVGGIDYNIHEITMQLPGAAWALPLPQFQRWLAETSAFRQAMEVACTAYSIQLGATALSNAINSVDERLARWLLMCRDRVDSDEIALTHEFISIMLAVRRPSVTTALHMLEGLGFIRSERGLITIRNRAAMEAFAADAYGPADREAFNLVKSSSLQRKQAIATH